MLQERVNKMNFDETGLSCLDKFTNHISKHTPVQLLIQYPGDVRGLKTIIKKWI